MKNRPLMAVTMGDPAGIGPEICVRILTDDTINKSCRLAIVGSQEVLGRVARMVGVNLDNIPVERAERLDSSPSPLRCIIDVPTDVGNVRPGACSAACGRAAFAYIETAIQAAIKGRVDAVVTAPINKKSLNLAGYPYAGHTEILAEKTGTQRYAMMLTSDVLTVGFVTTHIGYAEAAAVITPERVAEVIELTAEALQRIRRRPVTLGVCGLNPHAGEQGLFGKEEAERILPGIEAARAKGINVSGPFPADAAFTDQFRSRFDGLICQYHDQGHIPFKMLAFDRGVNVTLGLPIIRTSVDHGTAFDIAWQGIADTGSLRQAILLAVNLCDG